MDKPRQGSGKLSQVMKDEYMFPQQARVICVFETV